jgi:hypothetical protein
VVKIVIKQFCTWCVYFSLWSSLNPTIGAVIEAKSWPVSSLAWKYHQTQQVHILVSTKPKQARPRSKNRERFVTHSRSVEHRSYFQSYPFSSKGNLGILFWEPIHLHRGKPLRAGHIPEHAQLRGTFWAWPVEDDSLRWKDGKSSGGACLPQGHTARVWKVAMRDTNTFGHPQLAS